MRDIPWLWVAIGGGLTWFLTFEVKSKDTTSRYKRLYSYFAVLIAFGLSLLMWYAGIIVGNFGSVVVMSLMVYAANHLSGEQLVKLIKSKIDGGVK